MFTVASVQLNSQENIDRNTQIIERALDTACEGGAQLVVFPENACSMGKQDAVAPRFGQLQDAFCALAQKYQTPLIAGTLPCPYAKDGAPAKNGKFYQSSLAIDANGNVAARYDKMHLFVANVDDAVGAYDEGRVFLAGGDPTLATLSVGGQSVKVGTMVCFDLRFARLAQTLRGMGADILVAPSAFTYQTGRAHWRLLLQARALDSQCAVVGAAQGGYHGATKKRRTWGRSAVVAANAEVLADTEQNEVGQSGFLLAFARIDLAAQAKIRKDLPFLDCRRLP